MKKGMYISYIMKLILSEKELKDSSDVGFH